METPLVTVIIPSYNRASTLPRAIDSVLMQQDIAFELIIVDDASTDNSADILKPYLSSVRYIQHNKNQGAAASRNTGITAATTEYIAFLDSDDSWLAGKLKTQYNAMQTQPDIPLSVTAVSIHKTGCTPYNHTPQKTHKTWLDSMFHGQNFCPGSTLMAKRNLFESVGLQNPALKRLEDIDWLIRYFTHYDTITIVPDIYANVYASGNAAQNQILAALAQMETQHANQTYASSFALWKTIETLAAYWRSRNLGMAWFTILRFTLAYPSQTNALLRRILKR